MTNEAGTDLIHSGSLKLFERRKSRNSWTEYWVVLGGDSLRIFTSHESFLNASEEPMLIRLAADSSCESVNRNNRDFQFKIYAGDCFVFKCNTEHVRQEWLSKLQIILSNFCRKSCFHCSDVEHARISIQSDSGLGDLSSQKPEDNLYNEPGEIIQNTSNTTSTNSSRNSTGGEDQITLNSPLKIYDSEQRVYSSFNKNENIKVESKTDAVTESTASKQGAFEGAMKNEKSPKNSFGYIFDGPDNADNVTPSSLKLFECEKKKRFSTFSKTSLKRKQPAKEFVNPNFVLDDEDFAADVPEIPKRISKVYGKHLHCTDFRVFLIAGLRSFIRTQNRVRIFAREFEPHECLPVHLAMSVRFFNHFFSEVPAIARLVQDFAGRRHYGFNCSHDAIISNSCGKRYCLNSFTPTSSVRKLQT